MTSRSLAREWDPPPPAIATLLRRAVEVMLEEADELLAAIDAASFEVNRELLELAPGLGDALRAAGRSNVMVWALANMRKPGLPVPANLSPENLDFARDVVRHGFDETILSGFRTGQNLALRTATDVAFRVTDDHEALHELLVLMSQSIFAYVEDTLEGITATIRADRAQLRDAASAARAEAVALILEGAPISERRATQLLGYDVERAHAAAIVWSDEAVTDGAIESVTNDLARMSGAARPLTLRVAPSTAWVWLSGGASSGVSERLQPMDGIRVALGRPAAGLAGFRKSHQEAAATQRLARRLPLRSSLTSYDEVEVLALASANEDQARDFVARTLGPLADAPAEVRATLRTYLRQECNLSRTAQLEFAHRNTVAARLERARDLLPQPLADRTLEVSLALEIARILVA
ncbi:DNA-binding PucR family transcriptional regulator [Nocardioides aromaticivorans]|uniref:DNA-binding PucR family transcriptional regulator n=1 Tax=Nocardioides aromaticivorans TaxID=200618 RepID=A0A7Z0CKS9_9ACTN|nr:helix-turn-helix domain-containing protein [Nocardioides aromaticivorans]NYI44474.1 DNA-binding PucR family transcriptional regulator [Nocardioides aromaticivorans]